MRNKSNEIEIYRSLRKRIELSNPQDKVISIISNNSGDGKTDLTYKLGQSFAKSGKKVLLLDGNLRQPDLSMNLAKEDNNYIDSLLENKANIDSLTTSTDYENLYILPSQKSIDNSTEILESQIIKNIIEEARKDFDYIIIDTLSLSEGMDGIILGELSDGAIYITVENKTKAKTMEEYKTILEEADIKLIGAIYKKG